MDGAPMDGFCYDALPILHLMDGGAPTNGWGKLPSSGLVLCQTSTQEVPQTEPIKNSVKKGNSIIIHVGDTIMAAAADAGIDENWYLLDNQSTCKAFINKKYLSNIRDSPDGQYLRVHYNAVVTHTKTLVTSPDIPILYGITPRE